MRGLLKAFLIDPIDIPTDRANCPDRLGVTLLFNSGEFDNRVAAIVNRLQGKTISIRSLEWLAGPTTDFVTVLASLPEVDELALAELYSYPHHITLGWDDGSAPFKAALEAGEPCQKVGAISFERKAVIEWRNFD